VAERDEHLMEAPYLLTDTNRKGWGVRCSCGWRSPLLDEQEDALAAATEHLELDAETASKESTGWRARRRAKRQQRPDWMERRRE
jgi:hypothetical protein